MNARLHKFEFAVDVYQIDEAVASIFHTILFHRSFGKFCYEPEGNYSLGTLGYEDVDCNFIDFTYICCSSPKLDHMLKREISKFSQGLHRNGVPEEGQISLEFFQKKRTRWPFQPECVPWEIWTLRLEPVKVHKEHERRKYREKVGDILTEKILHVADIMNRPQYLPTMPNKSEVDLIFDTSFPDIQPFLFRIVHTASEPMSSSVTTTVKKLMKDTFLLY